MKVSPERGCVHYIRYLHSYKKKQIFCNNSDFNFVFIYK